MDAANLMSAYCCFESLAYIILKCLCHLNFWFSQTPRNLADSTGVISMPESCTIDLDKVCARMKCISSLFSGTNAILLITVHLSYIIHICSRRLQFVVISLLYTIRLVLFANPTIVIPFFSSSLYSKAMYRMNRIGDNGDSCDTLVWSSRRAASMLSNWRRIVCASR